MKYLKHKHSSKIFIITADKEYCVNLETKEISKRGTTGLKYDHKETDRKNYRIIDRKTMLSYFKRNSIRLTSEVEALLNVQLHVIYEYRLFSNL